MPSSDHAQDVPLLRTKLHVPAPRPNWVFRPRLIERLNAGLDCKLTLLSALPGSGKTTLLSEWVASSGQPVAWLSLDEGDNDPVRFLTYLVAALQTVEPGLGEGVLALMGAPQAGVNEAILIALLNDMGVLPEPMILVLDDYHLIKAQPVHHITGFLLDHLPPPVHLVISTRADPRISLSRLRARSELVEIRTADLRFTLDESIEFLNDCLGLALSAEQVTILEKRTEGWIAGLQLAGLSLQGRTPGDKQAFVTAFAGDDRYVVDYLLDEVLRRQPEPIQCFLLETSILDRLSSDLCDAVTGRDDSRVVLEELESANLFLLPLDAKRRWYRYHRLFSDLLRQRLGQSQPDRTVGLHRRASEWYAQNGFATEAVHHALAARDFESAAYLIESATWTSLFAAGMGALLGWLGALPQEVVRSRPRLGLIRAWALIGRMQFQAIQEQLRDVEQCLAAAGERRTQAPVISRAEAAEMLGEVAALRATIASMRGDIPAAVQLSQEALARLPAEERRLRGIVANTLGTAYNARGEVQAAAQAFAEAAELSRAAGNTLVALIALGNLIGAEHVQGQLKRAAQTCRRALDLAAEQAGAPPPSAGMAHVGLGGLHYEWNQLDSATQHLAEGIQLGTRAGIPELVVAGHVVLARVKQAQGDASAALETIREAEQRVHSYGASAGLAAQVAASRARLLAMQGRLESAAHWLQDVALGPEDEVDHLRYAEHVAQARVLLALGRLAGAEKLLAHLLRAAEAQRRTGHAIELLVLQSINFHALGDPRRAMAALAQALLLAEPEGYIRTFVDEGIALAPLLRQAYSQGIAPEYTQRLLAILGDSDGAAIDQAPPHVAVLGLVEPLTARELEVLRLIAAGLSNLEIAQELVVTLGTAKWHINNIYGKLGVHSRTQALSAARAHDLL